MMTQQKNKNYWQKIAQEYDKNVSDKGDIRHEKIIEPNGFEIAQDAGMNSDTPTFLIMKFKKLNR